MKSFLPPLLLLAAIPLLCLWNGNHLEQDCIRWQEELSAAETAVRQEDWPAAQDALLRSHRDWSSRQAFLRMCSTHQLLDESESLYQRIRAFASVEDEAELLADLSALQKQLQLLEQREKLLLRNIF